MPQGWTSAECLSRGPNWSGTQNCQDKSIEYSIMVGGVLIHMHSFKNSTSSALDNMYHKLNKKRTDYEIRKRCVLCFVSSLFS